MLKGFAVITNVMGLVPILLILLGIVTIISLIFFPEFIGNMLGSLESFTSAFLPNLGR